MKKSVLALSVISALFLAGCSSDDDSSSPEPTPEPTESREVAVTIAAAQLLPTSVVITSDEDGIPVLPEYIQQVDNKGYQHAILVKGYDLCYSDEIVTDKCFHNIDIYDATITLDVTGEATITISNPIVNSVYTSPVYTAFGEETLKVEDTQVEIKVTNKDWQYITVESSNDVEASYLNDLSMEWTEVSKDAHRNVDYDYSFGYVLIDSQVVVDTSKYGSLEADTTYEANGRVDLRVNFNENGNIIIGDPSFGDGDSPIIEPITPVVDENKLHFADITNDYNTGTVTIVPHESVRNDREDEAKVVTNVALGKKLSDYHQEFSFEPVSDEMMTPYISAYLKGALIDGRTVKNISIYGNGNETVTVHFDDEGGSITGNLADFQDYTVVQWNELGGLTLGNFYMRLNPMDAEEVRNRNAGKEIVITEYNFDLKP
ncbi:hypothetical protein AN944_02450 [Shewanella sp. P1-14-1]|uniref:hypothetical protein n=1 Tax=Shewanella sp. P1-14-1 TaxID=1723761 RepID=UPI0006D6776E|nr:hypothetical protein [Shewanella sp. P1-14-1]KPZ70066.1 hypothetical protein AN944_02450 [Shewanella sp. P1-14-1]